MTTSATLTTSAARTAQGFLDAFADGDVDAAVGLCDPALSVDVHPLDVHGKGTQVLRTVLHDLLAAFPDLMITVNRLIVTGDVVTALAKLEGTQAADYAGVPNQEKHIDLDEAWRFVVTEGGISAVSAYWCQQQLYRRLAVKRFDQVATG